MSRATTAQFEACDKLDSATANLTNIVNPIRKLLRKVGFFAGEVERIELGQRSVSVSRRFDRHTQTSEWLLPKARL
jgi:NADH dehydrogenase FAD-containing subunit